MRFFRSSEAHKSQRSKSRFSFRRHSDDDADVVKPPPPVPSSSSRKALSQSQPPRPPAYPLQQQQTTGKASVSSLTSTFVSSASTSAGSSVTSPSAIHRASSGVQQEDPLDDRSSSSDKIVTSSSSSALKRTSDSRTSTETDETDFVRTPSESSFFATTPRESFQEENDLVPQNILPLQNQHSMARTHSSSSNSSGLGSRSSSQRHSLVGYRQLEFSMSYKNRKTLVDDPLAPPGSGGSSSSSSSNSLRSSFNRRSETYRDSYNGGASAAHLSHIDELSPVHASAEQKPSGDPSPPHASGDHSTDDVEVRMTEANVAALQTRRALQQMVLSMEDDDYDSDDSDYRYDSRSSASYSGGIIHVGADDYRKFQFRLKQLEDLCSDQARKQADMEHTIERQVQQRTAKVVEAMEKKIAMYKQAKDLEVEREIQRRLSTESRGSVSRDSAMVFTGSSPLLLPPSMISSDADLKGKPLDKIFHPRRTRRRMELLKEREEQQKKEMEQFREFIRNTEMRSTQVTRSTMFMTPKNDPDARDSSPQTTQAARESIMALKDPHLTEDLLAATQNELIEMICVLRKHVSVQENQLDEAKKLISAAIEAREEAEDTAREAVELTMELDSRLERASQEMIELRRSSEFSMRSSYVDRNSQFTASFRSSTATNNGMTNANSQTNLPRTLSFPR